MKLTRERALRIHYILDQFVPPIIRDARWLQSIIFRLIYKKQAPLMMNFKERVWSLTDEEFAETYRHVEPVLMERDTDLTRACMREILGLVTGNGVLDVGCGKGLLTRMIAETRPVTAGDIVINRDAHPPHPNMTYVEANVERLPFADASFDTVVCVHTLEHVRDFHAAVSELRRVMRKRLIIVVPKQRPYRFTFDLHLHFFPYPHSLLNAIVPSGNKRTCREIAGDLIYVEDAERGVGD